MALEPSSCSSGIVFRKSLQYLSVCLKASHQRTSLASAFTAFTCCLVSSSSCSGLISDHRISYASRTKVCSASATPHALRISTTSLSICAFMARAGSISSGYSKMRVRCAQWSSCFCSSASRFSAAASSSRPRAGPVAYSQNWFLRNSACRPASAFSYSSTSASVRSSQVAVSGTSACAVCGACFSTSASSEAELPSASTSRSTLLPLRFRYRSAAMFESTIRCSFSFFSSTEFRCSFCLMSAPRSSSGTAFFSPFSVAFA
mmetsp:Transcript_10028/g.17751  ORF Transcript_10028/g.17751 Transcript_10028/m.17751 type:complete len:261 (-) Transcript_10028:2045-2827(-)